MSASAVISTYIGIGSNLAQPQQQVEQTFAELNQITQTCLTAQSPLYCSAPVGPIGQPDYINAVAELATTLSPFDLLTALQTIEQRHKRQRKQRWGPRTLDLDILLYGNLQQQHPRLSIPHPRLHERLFVLQPLFDIAPDLTIPGHGALAELLQRCPPLAIQRL